MHETALISGVMKIIEEYTAGYPGFRVTRVTLKVGEMTNAVPGALEVAFEVLSKGTVAEGAQLEIINIPLEIKCMECNSINKIEKHSFICPGCGSLAVEIIGGREMLVESLEVEKDGN